MHMVHGISVLLRCYYPFVLRILEYCSSVSASAPQMPFLASRAPGVFGGQALP